ncbi:hypothetical protein KAJ41_00440 [Candidatus Parcubacteria bacterium]|nr:hypothetical protein [Candidatus Parcubacteria bacterium]
MFNHKALDFDQEMPLVYTATSKYNFYFRSHISKFVLENEGVPLNPFMIFDYFLLDSVERDLVRAGNNNVVKRSDEVWVFGSVSDGVLAEIKIAKEMKKPIKYFKIEKSRKIISITKEEVEMEGDVENFRSEL